MNQAIAYEKLNELLEDDLILFRANLHAGSVPMHIWESRMEIIQDLCEVVTRIAGEKGFEIPSIGDLLRIQATSYVSPNENLQKYLEVSWQELEGSYFEKFAPSD